ncbi:MAG TPA: hypothetical protein VII33_09430, partial [Nakamurella sp.]
MTEPFRILFRSSSQATSGSTSLRHEESCSTGNDRSATPGGHRCSWHRSPSPEGGRDVDCSARGAGRGWELTWLIPP